MKAKRSKKIIILRHSINERVFFEYPVYGLDKCKVEVKDGWVNYYLDSKYDQKAE